jgi:hypothetical protein
MKAKRYGRRVAWEAFVGGGQQKSLSLKCPLAIVLCMPQPDEILPPDPDSVPTDPIARALWYGIDLTQLKENLRLTPTERLEKHRRTLEGVEALRKAGREHRTRTTPADSPRRRS